MQLLLANGLSLGEKENKSKKSMNKSKSAKTSKTANIFFDVDC